MAGVAVAGVGDGLDCCPRAAKGFSNATQTTNPHSTSVSFSFSILISVDSKLFNALERCEAIDGRSTLSTCAKIRHPFPQCEIAFASLRGASRVQFSRIQPRLFFSMTGDAFFNRSFGVSVLFVAIRFVAFNATGLVFRVRTARDSVIRVLNLYPTAFAFRIRMPGFFMATDALQHGFNARVFVRMVAILAALRIGWLDVISMIEIFDHAPFVVLPPMRTFFRIPQANDS